MKIVLINIIILLNLVFAKGISDIYFYQYAGYSYTITEYTRAFTDSFGSTYLYGETNNAGIVYDYDGFLKRHVLDLRTAVKFKYCYLPFDLTIGKENHLGYLTNDLQTKKTPDFFIEPTRNLFFISTGAYGKYKFISLGVLYNKMYGSDEIHFGEAINYWNYFNTNNNYSSFTLDFLLDKKIGKLPLYILARISANPQNGFKFNNQTIYNFSGGARLDFTYYINMIFKYSAVLHDNFQTRHMFTLRFNYNILPNLALSSSYKSVYYSPFEFPASRIAFGVEYIYKKVRKKNEN